MVFGTENTSLKGAHTIKTALASAYPEDSSKLYQRHVSSVRIDEFYTILDQPPRRMARISLFKDVRNHVVAPTITITATYGRLIVTRTLSWLRLCLQSRSSTIRPTCFSPIFRPWTSQAPWNVSRLVELRCLLPISLYDPGESSLGVLTTTNGPQRKTLKPYGHREQRTDRSSYCCAAYELRTQGHRDHRAVQRVQHSSISL